MPPHRLPEDLARPSPDRAPKQSDSKPMDFDWLEQRALRHAANWETTESGVAQLLERKVRERCARTNESPQRALEMIPEIVARLVEQSYVNDLRFAERAVERARLHGASANQIRAKLQNKGIGDALLASLLDQEKPAAESDAAWRLAKRRKLGPYCLDPSKREQSRNRHLSVFARAGFDFEISTKIVDATTIPESS